MPLVIDAMAWVSPRFEELYTGLQVLDSEGEKKACLSTVGPSGRTRSCLTAPLKLIVLIFQASTLSTTPSRRTRILTRSYEQPNLFEYLPLEKLFTFVSVTCERPTFVAESFQENSLTNLR